MFINKELVLGCVFHVEDRRKTYLKGITMLQRLLYIHIYILYIYNLCKQRENNSIFSITFFSLVLQLQDKYSEIWVVKVNVIKMNMW